MKFTRLRVLGFKSFVEPTEFPIEPGLTGVVGPNGCGKSNLVEALRWVMGESSYKAMRASGMDDVIFSGSGNRPARNTAEVSLVVDNSDRTAPAALNDADVLEVTRRIEREAGSIYRINGRDVRARDVQLLFADASTGAHSPAMVGQGKIGELIAAKPADRRALLEEAAGISGLHNRRHEAELRLKGAEQNLAAPRRRDRRDRAAARGAEAPGASGGALPQSLRRDPPAEATVLHLRWLWPPARRCAKPKRRSPRRRRRANERAVEQAEAGRVQAEAAAALPDLRDAAARAGAALAAHRPCRAKRSTPRKGASKRGSPNSTGGSPSSATTSAAKSAWSADNSAILARLDEEERELEAANAAMNERQATAANRRRAAEAAARRERARRSPS